MRSTLTPTLAIIIATGLAAGIALARPATTVEAVTTVAGVTTEVADPAVLDPAYGADGQAVAPPTPQAPAQQPPEIAIADFTFSSAAPVAAGQPVTVSNTDGVSHTLTSRDGLFDTGQIPSGSAAQITAPTTPGQYQFFCAIHPSMAGVLTVST